MTEKRIKSSYSPIIYVLVEHIKVIIKRGRNPAVFWRGLRPKSGILNQFYRIEIARVRKAAAIDYNAAAFSYRP